MHSEAPADIYNAADSWAIADNAEYCRIGLFAGSESSDGEILEALKGFAQWAWPNDVNNPDNPGNIDVAALLNSYGYYGPSSCNTIGNGWMWYLMQYYVDNGCGIPFDWEVTYDWCSRAEVTRPWVKSY